MVRTRWRKVSGSLFEYKFSATKVARHQPCVRLLASWIRMSHRCCSRVLNFPVGEAPVEMKYYWGKQSKVHRWVCMGNGAVDRNLRYTTTKGDFRRLARTLQPQFGRTVLKDCHGGYVNWKPCCVLVVTHKLLCWIVCFSSCSMTCWSSAKLSLFQLQSPVSQDNRCD